MKKLFLTLSTVILISCCGPQPKKIYTFEITYTNGDVTEISYQGVGDNLFSLVNGDLTTNGRRKTLVSGVRSYRLLSIKNIGMQTAAEAESCDCNLKVVTTE